MLSPEITRFCNRWLSKAEESLDKQDLQGTFDGFFSYFVAFNRLYGVATLDLARKGAITLNPRRFPDATAATSYVAQYVGSSKLMTAIDGDPSCSQALRQLCDLLDQQRFHISLDSYGNPEVDEDEILLRNLESNSSAARASAMLEIIYCIRCNMFHGQKGFDDVQLEILMPVIDLLRKTTTILLDELKKSIS